MTGREFRLRLDGFGKRLESDVALLARRITLIAFRSIVSKTPVDTGRLRNGWQVGIGARPTGERGGGEGRALSVLLSLRKHSKSIYINNNVPYAGFIEDGHSRQAPGGMIKPTIVELRRRTAQEWNRIRR